MLLMLFLVKNYHTTKIKNLNKNSSQQWFKLVIIKYLIKLVKIIHLFLTRT